MTGILRRGPRILGGLAALAAVAVAVLYVLALNSLWIGPNAQGYDLLAAANRGVAWIAVLAVLGVGAAFAGRPVRVPAGVLGLSSGVLGGLCLGTWALGLHLASVEPTSQPVDLNSLLLALAGSAYDVASAAVVLAIGAVALLVIRRVRIAAGPRNGTAVRATA